MAVVGPTVADVGVMGARSSVRTFAAAVVVGAATIATTDARAGDVPIAVGEVTVPALGSGVDASGLRAAADDEIQRLDTSRMPSRRKVLVSLALTKMAIEKVVTCTVSAMVRDARTGVMIAIIEAGAHAAGPVSPELRKRVANAAVRSAVRRVPRALGGE